MRSTIVIAAFALSVLTAPVPEPKPIYKSNGRSIDSHSRLSVKRDAAPIPEANPIFKSNEIGQNDRPNLNSPQTNHPKDSAQQKEIDEIDEESDQINLVTRFTRSGGKGGGKREVEGQDLEVDEERSTRGSPDQANHEITEGLDARNTRGKNPPRTRSVDPKTSFLGARTVRGPRTGSNKRTVEAEAEEQTLASSSEEADTEDVEGIQTRYIRGKPPRSTGSKTSILDTRTVRGPRTGSNKRAAEADPINRIHGQSGTNRRIGERTPEAEPINRIHG